MNSEGHQGTYIRWAEWTAKRRHVEVSKKFVNCMLKVSFYHQKHETSQNQKVKKEL